jgi:hypothetical protein
MSKFLQWGSGPPVEITTDGEYTLSDGINSIEVNVSFNQLPIEGTTDIISVKSCITIRGFCYLEGTTGEPTTDDLKVFEESPESFEIGPYSLPIENLNSDTNYRARSYAINPSGTGYGNTIDVLTLPQTNTRFWVGDSGDWDDTNHWSITSGGLGGFSVPDRSNNIYFDENSFPNDSTGIVNIDVSEFLNCLVYENCKELTFNILQSLTCIESCTIENNFQTTINGLFVLNSTAIWYGEGTVSEFYCYSNTFIYGNNYFLSLILDTDEEEIATFSFERDTNQRIDFLNILNASPTSQAIITVLT